MAGHCRPVIEYHQRLDRIGRVIGSEGQRVWQTHDWERLPALDPRYCVCVHCHAKRRRATSRSLERVFVLADGAEEGAR